MNDHPPTPQHRHYFEGNLLARSLLKRLMFPKHDSIFPIPPKAGRRSPPLLYPFTLWPNVPKVFGVRISLPPSWPQGPLQTTQTCSTCPGLTEPMWKGRVQSPFFQALPRHHLQTPSSRLEVTAPSSEYPGHPPQLSKVMGPWLS